MDLITVRTSMTIEAIDPVCRASMWYVSQPISSCSAKNGNPSFGSGSGSGSY
jgi:hypothetical protein